ncbi:hypothetical protein AAHA92_17303 [Salvia divinorum]|uniref:Reverse transcriptase zinc-binding domain-containing protein n=1 Tax=Salvia divinorum TaxID=28513 RepID=A0ABD1GYD0_SALDI
MSIFLWRLISNRIPVDVKLQWRKIELASKCYCCSERPNIEYLQHLFIQGEGAAKVWSKFDTWFLGRSYPLRREDSIPDRLDIWSKRGNHSAAKHISRLTLCLILWFLWAKRNKCQHKKVSFRLFSVVWQVQMHIWKLVDPGRLSPNHWKGATSSMKPFPIKPERRLIPVAKVAKWKAPDPPWLKLNVHGCCDDGTGKGRMGGVARDHYGNVVVAFTTPLKARTEEF